jgi:hypothetical protein
VALGAYESGNVLPAYTSLVVYIGHGPETVYASEKRPRVTQFYQASTSAQARQQLLAEGHVAWVIWGPYEQALGDFNPATAGYLRQAFSNGVYSVYEVLP